MTDANALQKLLPTVSTGSLVVDAALRGLLGALSAALSAVAVLVMKEHGLGERDVLLAIPDLVWATVGFVGTVGIVWWQTRAKQSLKDLAVNGALLAAQTQTVPAAVKELATPAQQIRIAVAGK